MARTNSRLCLPPRLVPLHQHLTIKRRKREPCPPLCQRSVPAFPVDTHIHRLAERWGLSSGKSVEQTEADLKAVFREELWNKLHLQLIWFGRQHCSARAHNPQACPVCVWAAPNRAKE